jgi:hypothetical protein
MMKASTSFLLLTLIAGAATAQETAARPDFSREAVQRFVMNVTVEEEDEIRARYDPLVANFDAFGTSWRIGYIPQLMMPMAGSQIGVTQTFPDAFSLLGVGYAMGPRAWRTQRGYARELKRINERINADVKVRTR